MIAFPATKRPSIKKRKERRSEQREQRKERQNKAQERAKARGNKNGVPTVKICEPEFPSSSHPPIRVGEGHLQGPDVLG